MAGRTDENLAAALAELAHHVDAATGDLARVMQALADARPLFGASDVSVALHDPRLGRGGPTRPWFAEKSPAGLEDALKSREGHSPLTMLRRLGGPCTRFDTLPVPFRVRARNSRYVMALSAAGRQRTLLGHIGAGHSVGRVEWYRSEGAPRFTNDDETRLRLLLPILDRALTPLVTQAEDEREAALVNGSGHLLWHTDGFRFQWTAASEAPIPGGRFALGDLLDEPMFGRPIAFQILRLGDADAARVHDVVEVPSADGTEKLAAEWTTHPGGAYGCLGQVMLLELRRVPMDREETIVPEATEASHV